MSACSLMPSSRRLVGLKCQGTGLPPPLRRRSSWFGEGVLKAEKEGMRLLWLGEPRFRVLGVWKRGVL